MEFRISPCAHWPFPLEFFAVCFMACFHHKSIFYVRIIFVLISRWKNLIKMKLKKYRMKKRLNSICICVDWSFYKLQTLLSLFFFISSFRWYSLVLREKKIETHTQTHNEKNKQWWNVNADAGSQEEKKNIMNTHIYIYNK